MIFSTGLKKIYESIGKQPQTKQEQLLDKLHEKIAGNKALAHKFMILDKIQENAGMLTAGQAKKFLAKLQEKHSSFLKENKEVALFYKEEKKLFEFFNINQKEVISEKLDLIVNRKDNQLNESIILDYVTNKRFVSMQEALTKIKPILKEHFSQIKFSKDENAFEASIENLKFNASLLEGEKKRMVEAAIKTVYSESFKNFESAVEKAYKLSLLTEKYLREFGDDEADYDEDKLPKGRTIKLPDLQFVKKITLEVPKNFDTDYVRFEFEIDIHHTEKTAYNIEVEFKERVIPMLNKLRRPFVQAIMQGSKGILEPNGINFQLWNLRATSLKPGTVYPASFLVTVDVNEDAKADLFPIADKGGAKGQRDLIAGYTQAAMATLKAFDAYLPTNENIAVYLTREAMDTALAGYDGTRSKEYVRRAGTKFQQADNRRVGDDSWLDQAIFRGDTRAENDEEPIVDDYSDIDSGQGLMPGALAAKEDDEADQQAYGQAKARVKPTFAKKTV